MNQSVSVKDLGMELWFMDQKGKLIISLVKHNVRSIHAENTLRLTPDGVESVVLLNRPYPRLMVDTVSGHYVIEDGMIHPIEPGSAH
jgi:hypothetical protein